MKGRIPLSFFKKWLSKYSKFLLLIIFISSKSVLFIIFFDKPEIPHERRFSIKRYESGFTRYKPFGIKIFSESS